MTIKDHRSIPDWEQNDGNIPRRRQDQFAKPVGKSLVTGLEPQ